MNDTDNIDSENIDKKKKLDDKSKALSDFINKTIKKQFEKEIKKETISPQELIERKQVQKDVNVLNSVIEEYLQSFMIIGFDIQGRKITLFHAKTEMERDALLEHLRSTVMRVIMNEGLG